MVELSYNNSHHESLKMSPYEVLYGRKCRTPSNWNGPKEKIILWPYMLKEMEQEIKIFCFNLWATQDQQKKYVDRKMIHKDFQVGDHVYLRIKPRKSTLQWSGYAKLAPHYCGPFQVLERIGLVAYQMALPSYVRVHNVFHIYLLKKYVYDP